MKSDRATRKLLAVVSTLGMVVGLSLTAGTAVASPSGSSGPRQQAVVTISGTSAVTVPGIHVESFLAAIH
ncbi:MAG: hypothetical protein ACRDNS_34655, partial [Trebonia sp.]